MTHSLTPQQLGALQTIERVASCFSLVGTTLVFVTFASSTSFRKPINRLIFYASWGNTLCNIATVISESGIRAGQNSNLCQFQSFLIQMFVPADALWNLAMAINVYMTLFKKYNCRQLKALEWKYHLMCYGGPFIIALTLMFVETSSRGKVYGPAILWCWISSEWGFMRLAVCYAPAWISIVVTFAIYVICGRKLFINRRQLRGFNEAREVQSSRTTDVQITTEPAGLGLPLGQLEDADSLARGRYSNRSTSSGKGYEQYSVRIASVPPGSRQSMVRAQRRKSNAALEANRAAWGYSKVAMLFFVSLLVTWVPSSINRVYGVAHPDTVSLSNEYAAGVVLSLMGFWNSVIYFTTSRAACKAVILRIFAGKPEISLSEGRRSSDGFEVGRSKSRSGDYTEV